jgi:hypothetical protein
MSHLNEVGLTYFSHLIRAWKWAFMLFVHGLFPNIWKTSVSDQMCADKQVSKATRDYLLKKMYNIDENKMPSIWDRASDRELAAKKLVASKDQ